MQSKNNEIFDNLIVWLNSQQAATYLGITSNAIRIMVHREQIRAYRLKGTRRLRFKKSELDQLMESLQEGDFQ